MTTCANSSVPTGTVACVADYTTDMFLIRMIFDVTTPHNMGSVLGVHFSFNDLQSLWVFQLAHLYIRHITIGMHYFIEVCTISSRYALFHRGMLSLALVDRCLWIGFWDHSGLFLENSEGHWKIRVWKAIFSTSSSLLRLQWRIRWPHFSSWAFEPQFLPEVLGQKVIVRQTCLSRSTEGIAVHWNWVPSKYQPQVEEVGNGECTGWFVIYHY